MNLPNPIHPQWQGPRTPREHAISTEPSHMRACLDELAGYCGRDFSGTFEIGRIQRPDRGGYVQGVYYGTGLPLFEIDWGTGYREVRAPDRKTLRAALAARWPRATVGR